MARPRSAAARLDRDPDAEHRIRRRRDRTLRQRPALRANPRAGDAGDPARPPHLWPIYAAAERHGLPLGIHAGSTFRHSTTSLGWPSYYIEDYAGHGQAFQSQVASLVCEGVFAKYPGLKVVLLESGVTWLPGFLWRFSKFWRGVRSEVPWVDRSPAEIVRDHIRLTIQPFDAPGDPDQVERAIDHLRSDAILLYASDFPHWQFDGDESIPAGIPAADCTARSWWTTRSQPMIASFAGARPMNIEVRQSGQQNMKARVGYLRLRYSSQERARGSAALSQQSLVGLFADLRAAPAPRLRQGLSLSQEPAAGLAAGLLAARRRFARERPRLHAGAAP